MIHDNKRNGTTPLFAALNIPDGNVTGGTCNDTDIGSSSASCINRFVPEQYEKPLPFTWTAEPDKIFAAVKRGYQALDSIH